MSEKNLNPKDLKEIQDEMKNVSAEFLLKECGFDLSKEEPVKYPKITKRLAVNGKPVVNSAAFDLICKQEAKVLVSGIDPKDPDFLIAVLAVKASKFFEFDGKTLTAEEVLNGYDSNFLFILSGAMI